MLPLQTILGLLLQYKYFILFPVAVVEGPIITILAGFAISLGYMNWLIAYVVAVIGDLTGDNIYYLIGRWGRQGWIRRWGKYIGLHEVMLEKLETHFKKHSSKTLIFGKVAQGLGSGVLVAAGLAKVPYMEFLFVNTLGTMAKSFILVMIGYYFGTSYAQINSFLDYTTIVTLCIAVFLVGLYITISRLSRKKSKI